MKLFFSPAACSLSPHITLRESGLPFELVRIDMVARTTADGADYLKINPKGQVPALQLDDGQIITEGPVIVQYVADRVPEKKLVPPVGSIERYRVPAMQPSCPAFIGRNADRLAVTTAWEGLDEEARSMQPQAGALLELGLTVRGVFDPPYKL